MHSCLLQTFRFQMVQILEHLYGIWTQAASIGTWAHRRGNMPFFHFLLRGEEKPLFFRAAFVWVEDLETGDCGYAWPQWQVRMYSPHTTVSTFMYTFPFVEKTVWHGTLASFPQMRSWLKLEETRGVIRENLLSNMQRTSSKLLQEQLCIFYLWGCRHHAAFDCITTRRHAWISCSTGRSALCTEAT